MPILPTADHRAASGGELLEAVRRGDALAFAEACSRTLPAAHGVSRRLVAGSGTETVLREVYALLWSDPPHDAVLERWVRQRCFDAACGLLRAATAPPATPSAHALVGDLPAPAPAFVDGTEQALEALDATSRLALLRAHDAGLRADDLGGSAAATRGLLALAGSAAPVPAGGERGAEWMLGLLPPGEAEAVSGMLQDAGGDLARELRRGRRRLEGLPPGPDLAARVVAATLAGGGPPRTGHVEEPGSVEERGSVEEAGYGDQPGDVEEAGYVEEPGYVEEAGYGDQPGDVEEPGYVEEAGYGDQPGDVEEAAGAGAAEPRRSGWRRLVLVVAWLAAIAAAVGTGMLAGWLLLDLGVLQ